MARAVYVLRIKPGRQDMVPQALEKNALIIGWTDVPELLDSSLTREDFRSALSRMYYPDAKTLGRAGSATGNMWRFLREMSIGDIVLVPHRENFYVAEVIGAPTHDSQASEGGFRRAARWLNNKRPFTRDDQPDVYSVLLERKTCYQVNLTHRPEVTRFVSDIVDRSDVAVDLAQLAIRTDIDSTTRKTLVDARVGQGRFREELLLLWGQSCAVTGCTESGQFVPRMPSVGRTAQTVSALTVITGCRW